MIEAKEPRAGRCGAPALIAAALAACLVLPPAGYFVAGLLQPRSSKDLGEEAVLRRIQPQAQIALAPGSGSARTRTTGQIYQATCAACHDTAAAGAPRRGDRAAWAPRLKAGLDALAASAAKGKGAMPPKGGDASLADAEIRALVEYLTTK